MGTIFSSFRFRLSACAGVIAATGIQFIRPDLKNPPVAANFDAPPQVEKILRDSCYNCHSNETRLNWFDRIAPAYWIVANDVKQARSHLNFSDLGRAPAPDRIEFLVEAVTQIKFGAMPLPSYRIAHPGSRVTPEQLAILKNYLAAMESHKVSDPPDVTAAAEQYRKWIGKETWPAPVRPAPNGIEFPAGYRDWKVISSTDREDNSTLREVLGNDVAIKAIQAGNINPWPDGAIFAKVAWYQLIDVEGRITPGQFKQVEFMIKDSQKYAGTKGWGWARWIGPDLTPYGANGTFTTSCVSCHLPLSDNDFVFTKPFKGQP